MRSSRPTRRAAYRSNPPNRACRGRRLRVAGSLSPSTTCARFDGFRVDEPTVRWDEATDTYTLAYRARSQVDGTCPGNDGGAFDNPTGEVAWIGVATNAAPSLSVVAAIGAGQDIELSGSVADHHPERLAISLASDLDGPLGTTSPAVPLLPSDAVQTTSWVFAATGLSAGSHVLTVTVVDEAGIERSATAAVDLP